MPAGEGAAGAPRPAYLILLASTEEQVGEAFAAGADDRVHAAAGQHELQARLFAARRLGGMA